MTALVRISYKNATGAVIPPFSIIQLTGVATTDAGGASPVLQATVPNSSVDGAYAIDDGGGAAATGPQAYGSCFRPFNGVCWAACIGSSPAAWAEVGPSNGLLTVDTNGNGFYFAGKFDATNKRMLVTQRVAAPPGDCVFRIVTIDCMNQVASCRILYNSKGSANPAPGSLIKVCDYCGSFFVGSHSSLIGAVGFAREYEGFECEGPATGTSTSHEDTGTCEALESGTGTGTHQCDESMWMVYQMCGLGVSC